MTQQKTQDNHSSKNQENSRDDYEIRYQDQDKNQSSTKQDDRSDRDGDSSNRGFASMDSEKQREIASKGGKAAHEKGTAHEFSSEEAREAGQKGGKASHAQEEHKGTQQSHDGKAQSR